MLSAVSAVQIEESGVVKDQAGHKLVDEKGFLVCSDKRCRAPIDFKQMVAQMVSEGVFTLDEIGKLAYANHVVHVGLDQYDPGVIHSQWIELYKKWGVDKNLQVGKPTFTREKVVEMANLPEPRVPIFVHPKLTLPMFDVLFPPMRGHWSLKHNSGVENSYELSGWLFVEAALEAPWCSTKQEQLGKIFDKLGAKGLTLVAYYVFAQYCKETQDRYPDFDTWARLLGSSGGGRVLNADFGSDGGPDVNGSFGPSSVNSDLGGRSAVVV
ncbi:MAG: hypothetical protein WED59_00780 [Candidatus Woykebacteria bacterium]